MISEVLLNPDSQWFCVCGLYLMKEREGGSGGCVKGPVKSWVHRLLISSSPFHTPRTASSVFLGSPGSSDHFERCSDLFRKLPISED